MKRIMIVLFTLCLLLSACGKAPVEPVGAVEPSATESPAEPTPSPAAREQRKLEEGEEWLRENYIHWGKFYAKKEDYDAFLASGGSGSVYREVFLQGGRGRETVQ